MKKILNILLAVALLTTVACKQKQTEETKIQTEETKTQEEGATNMETTQKFTEPKQAAVDVNKTYIATITTSQGKIVCELSSKDAPLSATNFIQLANGGFYNGLTFHRYEPGFVIQGGDPTGTGSGGPGYTIPAEIKLPHKKGALAWARTGDQVNPERRSSGSQFYITLEATPFLDGAYTVFGQTIEGMDVVEKLRKGDTIQKIEITEK